MNGTGVAQREPEIYREQETLTERLAILDKTMEELRSEIGQMENVMKIALRPSTPTDNIKNPVEQSQPSPSTQLGERIRQNSDLVRLVTDALLANMARLRDLRDRCELPRLPETATQAMPEIYPGTRDSKY